MFNQLLLYLSVCKDQVFTGLTILACNDAACNDPKEIKTNEEMVCNCLFLLQIFDEFLEICFEKLNKNLLEVRILLEPLFACRILLEEHEADFWSAFYDGILARLFANISCLCNMINVV